MIIKNIVLHSVDTEDLKNQKTFILGLLETSGGADELEGLLSLLDSIQDYCVDQLHHDPKDIYNIQS